jgi:hypothetical protein
LKVKEEEDDLSGYSESAQKRIREAQKEREERKRLPAIKHESKSLVAPMKPEAVRPGGRGSPTSDFTRAPTTDRPTANRVPDNVPTTLEKALQFEGEGKGVHEVLGTLIASHEKEAMAILERTNVGREDVVTVADVFQLAKHGIGGEFEEPWPFLSEWALVILKTLPSVGGKSREEFVQAWVNAEKERSRQQMLAEKNDKRISG